MSIEQPFLLTKTKKIKNIFDRFLSNFLSNNFLFFVFKYFFIELLASNIYITAIKKKSEKKIENSLKNFFLKNNEKKNEQKKKLLSIDVA
jgi:hypothetical protein